MGFSMLLHLGEDFCRFYIHQYTCHVQQQPPRSSASLAVVVGDAQVRAAVAGGKKKKPNLPHPLTFSPAESKWGGKKNTHTQDCRQLVLNL